MAYTAGSFSFGEQPSTSKWNNLWENDASFHDGTGIADGAITAAKRSGGIKVGSFQPTSTGNFSVTGVGFKPKSVSFQILPGDSTNNHSTAWGVMDENGNQFVHAINDNGSSVARISNESACILEISAGGSTAHRGRFVSMDSDGFTVDIDVNNNTQAGYVAYA